MVSVGGIGVAARQVTNFTSDAGIEAGRTGVKGSSPRNSVWHRPKKWAEGKRGIEMALLNV